MKTRIFLLTILLMRSFSAFGQINLEATYDSASINLYMVTLEVEGDKYVRIQKGDSAYRFIRLYNLDHSIWKTIDCNNFPIFTFLEIGPLNNGRFSYNVLYITEHLFDNDDQIEFLYTVNTGLCPQYYTGIYNEDGTILFAQDSAAPLVTLNVPIVAKPIYNTPLGTKMILSFPCTKQAKVYSLSGTLPITNILAPENADYNSLVAYPNPSSSYTTLEYKLPNGITQGEIVIHDLKGMEIKRYTIDSAFNNLVIYNNEFSSGTYFYSLLVNNKILVSKKIIVVH